MTLLASRRILTNGHCSVPTSRFSLCMSPNRFMICTSGPFTRPCLLLRQMPWRPKCQSKRTLTHEAWRFMCQLWFGQRMVRRVDTDEWTWPHLAYSKVVTQYCGLGIPGWHRVYQLCVASLSMACEDLMDWTSSCSGHQGVDTRNRHLVRGFGDGDSYGSGVSLCLVFICNFIPYIFNLSRDDDDLLSPATFLAVILASLCLLHLAVSFCSDDRCPSLLSCFPALSSEERPFRNAHNADLHNDVSRPSISRYNYDVNYVHSENSRSQDLDLKNCL